MRVCQNGPAMTTPTSGGGPPIHEPTVAEHVGHADVAGHAAHGAEESTPLGPIDIYAWGAGILGIALGLAVALAFAVSAGMVG